MRLFYPTSNPDERVLTVTATAGSFTPDQFKDLEARAFIISASIRGEVGLDVIRALDRKGGWLVADLQGFLRVVAPDGTLRFDPWPAKEEVLAHVDILKTDAVEAEALTGERDMKAAARVLAGLGPKEIVLTHRDGVLVLAAGEFFAAPFLPREAGRAQRPGRHLHRIVRDQAPERAAGRGDRLGGRGHEPEVGGRGARSSAAGAMSRP